jgi:hypothetical protein
MLAGKGLVELWGRQVFSGGVVDVTDCGLWSSLLVVQLFLVAVILTTITIHAQIQTPMLELAPLVPT